MAAPIETLTTQNVVGSTKIDQEVDLDTLASDLDGGTYDPDRTPGLIYRLQDSNATSIVFRTGRLVSTGAQSKDKLMDAINETVDEFRDLGLDVPEQPDVEIHNLVATGDFESRLNLSAIAVGLGLEHIEYEPEHFSGLVYRPPGESVVALLFGSGKVVLAGARSWEELEDTLESVYQQLEELDLLLNAPQ